MTEGISGPASTTVAPSSPAPSASEPATTAPATASAPASPLSLSDALQQATAATDVPEATAASPAGDQPAPAIQEPPKSDAPVVPGEPPKERWPDILANTREKSKAEGRQEAEAEVRQRYGEAIQFAEAFNANPVETIAHLVASLQQHPDHGPALRSHAAKVLGQRQQKAVEDAEPEADLQTADGQLVYSAPQLAKHQQWFANKLRRELQGELSPVMEIVKERQAEQVKAQEVQKAVASYKPFYEELQSMPGWAEHRADIVARQSELFKANPSMDPMRLLMRAYREIVPGKLQAQQQQSQEALALQKAAGRSDNPAAVVAHPSSSPKSLTEAFAQVGLR